MEDMIIQLIVVLHIIKIHNGLKVIPWLKKELVMLLYKLTLPQFGYWVDLMGKLLFWIPQNSLTAHPSIRFFIFRKIFPSKNFSIIGHEKIKSLENKLFSYPDFSWEKITIYLITPGFAFILIDRILGNKNLKNRNFWNHFTPKQLVPEEFHFSTWDCCWL